MSWALFREVHFKVICAVLVVIASMLVLQSGLNQLKFRSLVADATASSLQVVASTVETAVQRAEQVGLAVEEMTGLEDLMLREMQLNAGITLLMVVSPVGTPLVSVGGDALPEADRSPEEVQQLREHQVRALLFCCRAVVLMFWPVVLSACLLCSLLPA